MSKKGSENIHKDHRKRMRSKFEKIGFEGWSDYEILEYLLYNVYRRGDTNVTAHRLLDYSAKSFVTLMENTKARRLADDVMNVGDETVLFLRSIKEFIKFYKLEELKYKPVKLSRENIREVINIIGFSTDKEDILMICMDEYMNVKNVVNITEKSGANYAGSSATTIINTASANRAKYVLLVHNHPDGCKRVSVEDMNMTIRADMILDNMGIKLIDHIIVSDDEYISVKVTVFNIEEETGKGWEEQYESYVE